MSSPKFFGSSKQHSLCSSSSKDFGVESVSETGPKMPHKSKPDWGLNKMSEAYYAPIKNSAYVSDPLCQAVRKNLIGSGVYSGDSNEPKIESREPSSNEGNAFPPLFSEYQFLWNSSPRMDFMASEDIETSESFKSGNWIVGISQTGSQLSAKSDAGVYATPSETTHPNQFQSTFYHGSSALKTLEKMPNYDQNHISDWASEFFNTDGLLALDSNSGSSVDHISGSIFNSPMDQSLLKPRISLKLDSRQILGPKVLPYKDKSRKKNLSPSSKRKSEREIAETKSSMTYINKGQVYHLRMSDNSSENHNEKTSLIWVDLEEGIDRTAAWSLWVSGRMNEGAADGFGLEDNIHEQIVHRPLTVKYHENQSKILQNSHSISEYSNPKNVCIESTDGLTCPPSDIMMNSSVLVKWSETANLDLQFEYLSTDFTSVKGVRGITSRLNILTKFGNSFEWSRCDVRSFRDKGADRKIREESQRLHKKGMKYLVASSTDLCLYKSGVSPNSSMKGLVEELSIRINLPRYPAAITTLKGVDTLPDPDIITRELTSTNSPIKIANLNEKEEIILVRRRKNECQGEWILVRQFLHESGDSANETDEMVVSMLYELGLAIQTTYQMSILLELQLQLSPKIYTCLHRAEEDDSPTGWLIHSLQKFLVLPEIPSSNLQYIIVRIDHKKTIIIGMDDTAIKAALHANSAYQIMAFLLEDHRTICFCMIS